MIDKVKKPTLLEQLQVQYGKNQHIESTVWFKKQVRTLINKNITPPQMLAIRERLTILPTLGKMYLFLYTPKHAATLPFYDTFPLVLPISTDRTGMLGLNLHYLPYKQRMILLNVLYDFTTNDKMDEKTKIMATWNLLQNSAADKLVKPCIKRYLRSYIKSPYLKINATEWPIVTMLPLARFEKATQSAVWQDSLSKVK